MQREQSFIFGHRTRALSKQQLARTKNQHTSAEHYPQKKKKKRKKEKETNEIQEANMFWLLIFSGGVKQGQILEKSTYLSER